MSHEVSCKDYSITTLCFPAKPPQLPIRYLLEEECIKEEGMKTGTTQSNFPHDPAMLLIHGRLCRKTAARGLKEAILRTVEQELSLPVLQPHLPGPLPSLPALQLQLPGPLPEGSF